MMGSDKASLAAAGNTVRSRPTERAPIGVDPGSRRRSGIGRGRGGHRSAPGWRAAIGVRGSWRRSRFETLAGRMMWFEASVASRGRGQSRGRGRSRERGQFGVWVGAHWAYAWAADLARRRRARRARSRSWRARQRSNGRRRIGAHRGGGCVHTPGRRRARRAQGIGGDESRHVPTGGDRGGRHLRQPVRRARLGA
jgi:hypothetical protein